MKNLYMGDVLKNVRLVNPSVTGNLSLNGVDVTEKLMAFLSDTNSDDRPVKKAPVDDNKVRLLSAEIEGLKAMCMELTAKVDSLSKAPKVVPKEVPKEVTKEVPKEPLKGGRGVSRAVVTDLEKEGDK